MVKILEEVDIPLAFMSWLFIIIKKTPTAMACEVLARRIIHLTEPDNLKSVMSMRYKYRQMDGDESEMSNALELAIDQHWYFYTSNSSILMTKTRLFYSTVFLSSSESQEGENFSLLLSVEIYDFRKSCQCTLEWWPHSEKQRE
jgi:hypothetical protein